MTFAVWSSKLEVGVPEIDQQHKELFNMLNRLHTAVNSGDGAKAVGVTLERLSEYVEIHFRDEESLMEAKGYPDRVLHQEEHRKLAEQVLVMMDRYASGQFPITNELLRFLRRWLYVHIAHSDMLYSRFLRTV